MNTPLEQAEYEKLAAFRYALRQFMHFSEQAAAAVGLTPQQHQALLAIKGFPDGDAITIGELAGRLFIRHHSAVGLVDRLEAQGLLTRQPAEADRRQVQVQLTPAGEAILAQLSSAHRQELRKLGPHLQAMLAELIS